MPTSSSREVIAQMQLEQEGWVVFNTNNGFPDLFCLKDGKVKLVEVKDEFGTLRSNQRAAVAKLQAYGVDVEIVKLPALPRTQQEALRRERIELLLQLIRTSDGPAYKLQIQQEFYKRTGFHQTTFYE